VSAPELLLILERRVAALRTPRPDLEDALSLQELLIRTVLTSARPPRAHPFPLPKEHLATRVRSGVPLLDDQPAFVDVHYAADLFSRLVDALQIRDDSDLQTRLSDLVNGTDKIDPERLFGEAFVQHHDHLIEIAQLANVDPELLETLARVAVAPLLRAYAEQLMPLVERADDGTPERAVWAAGYCPICGSWPGLGELRGIELAQWLRCSACGSAWRTQRLACPYCANDDFRSLGSLTIEGEARFRIAVCERCNGYLKVCNAFDPAPAELLALDDAVSLHLDVAAIDRGYRRPDGSGFVIELAVPEAEWVEELA
jgi:FdhE protein